MRNIRPPMRLRPLLSAVAIAVTCVAWSAATTQPLHNVTGVARAKDQTPLAAARVSVAGTDLVTYTALDGSFALTGVRTGKQAVEVRAFGYEMTVVAVVVEPGKVHRLDVVLVSNAQVLPAVEVKEVRHVSPGLRAFEERRARGLGKFYDRDDIARMQPRVFTDILRRVPGLHFQGATGAMVQSQRTQGITGQRPCQMLFYMNGSPFPLPPDGSINNFVAAEEVVALEVYTGASELPPEFNSTTYNSRCGVVVVWTRNGRDARR